MLPLTKRAITLCLALILILTVMPLSVFRVHAEENDEEKPATMVQSVLDFTVMHCNHFTFHEKVFDNYRWLKFHCICQLFDCHFFRKSYCLNFIWIFLWFLWLWSMFLLTTIFFKVNEVFLLLA